MTCETIPCVFCFICCLKWFELENEPVIRVLMRLLGLQQVLVGESIVKQKDPTAGIAELFGKNIA